MNRTRINTKRSLVTSPPVCVNFSEIESKMEEEGTAFVPGDDGLQSREMEDNVAYEVLICDILTSLEGDDKTIFLLQLLRNSGYRIDHGSFARALHMSRTKYMNILSDVKLKINLYLIGEKMGLLTKEDR